jgi:hypothetical protein
LLTAPAAKFRSVFQLRTTVIAKSHGGSPAFEFSASRTRSRLRSSFDIRQEINYQSDLTAAGASEYMNESFFIVVEHHNHFRISVKFAAEHHFVASRASLWVIHWPNKGPAPAAEFALVGI